MRGILVNIRVARIPPGAWRLVRQSLQTVKAEGDPVAKGDTVHRHFDVMEMITPAREEKTIYADTTGFYGKFDP